MIYLWLEIKTEVMMGSSSQVPYLICFGNALALSIGIIVLSTCSKYLSIGTFVLWLGKLVRNLRVG